MSSQNGHETQQEEVDHSSCANVSEVGWYVLGENQQQIGPYVFSELRGEFSYLHLLHHRAYSFLAF